MLLLALHLLLRRRRYLLDYPPCVHCLMPLKLWMGWRRCGPGRCWSLPRLQPSHRSHQEVECPVLNRFSPGVKKRRLICHSHLQRYRLSHFQCRVGLVMRLVLNQRLEGPA